MIHILFKVQYKSFHKAINIPIEIIVAEFYCHILSYNPPTYIMEDFQSIISLFLILFYDEIKLNKVIIFF